MGKKLTLVGAVVALLAVIGGVTYFAATRMRRRETTGLACVPRDVIGVVSFNADRIRSFPPVQRLRQLAMAQPDAQRFWVPFVAACGFDPLDRVNTLTLAWDRTVFTDHGSMPGLSVVALGRITTAEIMRAFAAMARLGQGRQSSIVPLAPINNHPVVTFVTAGEAPSADNPRVAVLDNGIVTGTAAGMQRAVNVADHREPGADRNDQLRGAMIALDGELFMYGVVDVAALLQSLPPSAMTGLQTMTIPGFPSAAAQLQTIQSSGMGLMRHGDGLRGAFVVNYRTSAEATNASTMAQMGVGLVRVGAMSEFVRQEQQYMARLQAAQALDPSIALQIAPIQQLFALVNALPARIVVRADGVTVHVELDVSGAEMNVIEAGSRALVASDASMTRTRRSQDLMPMAPPAPPAF